MLTQIASRKHLRDLALHTLKCSSIVGIFAALRGYDAWPVSNGSPESRISEACAANPLTISPCFLLLALLPIPHGSYTLRL